MEHLSAESQPSINLSTKVTMIVFWGLIIVGLLFASLLLNNRALEIQERRAAIADSIAYHIDQLLYDRPIDTLEVNKLISAQLGELGDIAISFTKNGQKEFDYSIVDLGANPQHLLRFIDIESEDGARERAEIVVSFPNIESTLHRDRSRLLLSLGALLLVFGVIIKLLMERILTLPMSTMVRTAREISVGNVNLAFDEKRHDEFGYLAQFINHALEKMRSSEREAQRSREFAEVTLESIGDAVVTTNKNGRVMSMNPAAERILNFTIDEARGQFLPDIMQLIVEETGAPLEHPVLRCLRENRIIDIDTEGALLLPAGELVPITDTAAPIRDSQGELRGAVIVFHDVSEARKLKRELSYQACHDSLTGLYNRREFDHEVQRVIEYGGRDGHVHALCYLDLDQFKIVNDTCGHAAGDQLLIKLTNILRSKLRKADVLARLGGDEFGLLLTHCSLLRAIEVAEGVREMVNDFRFSWQGKTFQIGVSIGLVELSPLIHSAADALAAADMACYAAKDDGRNRVHVYHHDNEDLSRRREEMGMVSAVQRALADDSLELFAQIIAPLNAEAVLPHYEILVRMRDPKGLLIPPGAFIPAAERFQLMSSIDRWVISHSLRFAAQQANSGKPVELSINLSGQSLSEDMFLDYVILNIEQSGVRPEYLCFEITETAAINNMARAVRFMTSIRQLGCHFALDDFGSGMSSFGYLKSLPVDILKIDGGFIKRLNESAVDQAMVKAIHEVARLMNMKTVAEFVENAEIVAVLREIGVDMAQGYHIGKPAPLAELFPGCYMEAVSGTAPQLKVIRS